MRNQLRETLADYAHVSWTGWMEYQFRLSILNADGSVTIPKPLVDHWKGQLETAYKDLPEKEKNSDRHEADRVLAIFEAASTVVLDEKATVAIGAGLAVLDRQLREMATSLEIPGTPDARIESDWVERLLVTIDVLGQRVDMIGSKLGKPR